MRHERGYRMWITPDGDESVQFYHVSYVIFRTDCEDTAVIAARCPDLARFAEGRSVIDALLLDEEAQAYLFDGENNPPPLVVMTDVGLGILDKRYDGYAGVGVYWHIHGRPNSLARMINNGILGAPEEGKYRISSAVAAIKGEIGPKDLPSYRALWDALGFLDKVTHEWPVCDGQGCFYRQILWTRVRDMAEFVGCDLTEDVSETISCRIKCRRPMLLEVLLLCLLAEVKAYSATGGAVCRLSTLGDVDGEGLSFELSFPVEKYEKVLACMESAHRHLGWVCELGGLELHAKAVRLKRGEKQTGKPPQIRMTLEWLHDPVVLSTSDLKAKIRFFYEN